MKPRNYFRLKYPSQLPLIHDTLRSMKKRNQDNMNIIIKISALIACAAILQLTGCSRLPQKYQLIRDNSNDYQQAQTIPNLKTPKGYNTKKTQPLYVVPKKQATNSNAKVDMMPPTVYQTKTQ